MVAAGVRLVPPDRRAGAVAAPSMGRGEGQAAVHAEPAPAVPVEQSPRVDAVPPGGGRMARRCMQIQRVETELVRKLSSSLNKQLRAFENQTIKLQG